MRNLKKFLALVLAMMMVFSLMVTANAYTVKTDFVDDKDITYKEAAAVLQDLKIYEGGDNGEMDPGSDFTRAYLATLMYRVLGSPAGTSATAYQGIGQFEDVKETDWFNPYVNYVQMAGYIHGVDDTHFDPYGKVTGYHVLALILQAMGYGEKGEFVGPGWKTYTVSYARSAGIDVTLTDSKLSDIATREEVAMMVFQAMQRPKVTWLSLTNNYVPAWVVLGTKNSYTYRASANAGEVPWSLGYEHFGLYSQDPIANLADWGRPYKRWYDARPNGGNYTLFPYETDVKFHEAIDECDIVDDFNLADGTINTWYMDNYNMADSINNVTSDPNTHAIRAQGVGSQIGGQGQVTEIYKIGTGYWVVQINTFLAKVIDVIPTSTDRNGHQVPRSIKLEIYDLGRVDDNTNSNNNTPIVTPAAAAADTTGATVANVSNCNVTTNDWAKGEYVLVDRNYNRTARYTILQAAPVIAVGELNSWDDADYPNPASHTIGETEKPDALTFNLNWRASSGGTWAAFGNEYNDFIGLGVANYSYAVIERIQWTHPSIDDDGYVVANLIGANGSRIPGVHIATVNGKAVKNVEDADTAISEFVTDDWTTNTGFYGHLVTYSVNDETGEYNIYAHDMSTAALTGGAPAHTDTAGGAGRSGNITDAGRIVTPAAGLTPAVTTYYGAIVKGDANIWNDIGSTTDGAAPNGKYSTADGDQIIGVGTGKTVYLVRNEQGRYDIITGKDNVPTISGADICILADEDGYATLVVVDGVTASATTTNVYYVPKAAATLGSAPRPDSTKRIDIKDGSGLQSYNGYVVYALGSRDKTTLYDPSATVMFRSAGGDGINKTGLYEITTDKYGIVTDVKQLAVDDTPAVNIADAKQDNNRQNYMNVSAYKVESSTSIQAMYSGGTPGTDDVNLNLRSTATIIEVNIAKTSLKIVNTSSIEENDTILVAFDIVNGVNQVNYIYIIKAAASVTPPSPPSGTVTQPEASSGAIASGDEPDIKEVGDPGKKADPENGLTLADVYNDLGIDVDDDNNGTVTVTIPRKTIVDALKVADTADYYKGLLNYMVAGGLHTPYDGTGGSKPLYVGVYLGGVLKSKVTKLEYWTGTGTKPAALADSSSDLEENAAGEAFAYIPIGNVNGTTYTISSSIAQRNLDLAANGKVYHITIKFVLT